MCRPPETGGERGRFSQVSPLENQKLMPILLDNQNFVRHRVQFIILNSKKKDVIKMVCSSVKEGQDCFFMSKKGCGFNGGTCHIIVEECEGCQRVAEYPTGKYCMAFPDPAAKWHAGRCNMATHLQAISKKENGKVNPLKASKRLAH